MITLAGIAIAVGFRRLGGKVNTVDSARFGISRQRHIAEVDRDIFRGSVQAGIHDDRCGKIQTAFLKGDDFSFDTRQKNAQRITVYFFSLFAVRYVNIGKSV